MNGQPRPALAAEEANVAVAEQIASLSRLCGLVPGDVIGTGLPAGSAVTLTAGDRLTMTATDLGRLTLSVEGPRP